MRNREDGLPDADGPLVSVQLPDAQTVYAVARGRRQEADGAWVYKVELPLWASNEVRGRWIGEPSPVTFFAPAAKCSPVEGEDYSELPTERVDRTPRWYVEERKELNAPARWVVHRGDCHAGRGDRRPADDHQALAALTQDDTVACTVCRPDRVLLPPELRSGGRWPRSTADRL